MWFSSTPALRELLQVETSPEDFAARFFAAFARTIPDEAPANRDSFDAGAKIDNAALMAISPDALDRLAGSYLAETASRFSAKDIAAEEDRSPDLEPSPNIGRQTEQLKKPAHQRQWRGLRRRAGKR
jgi:hypothetical protein